MQRRTLIGSLIALLAVLAGYFSIGGSPSDVAHLLALFFIFGLVAAVFFASPRSRRPH